MDKLFWVAIFAV